MKVIKDYKGRQVVMATAFQSGMSQSTIATILKSKNKGNETTENLRRTCVRYGETCNDTDGTGDTAVCPLGTMRLTVTAQDLFLMLKEKAGPSYDVNLLLALGGLNYSSIVIHSIM